MAEILIPFYGKPDLLIRCLRSLARATGGRNKLILIDDGSPREERRVVDQFLKSFSGMTEILTHAYNRGYKEAICTGFLSCRQQHIILLNSDTVVTADFDLLLLEVLINNPTIRAVAPVSNHPTDLYQYREMLRNVTPDALSISEIIPRRQCKGSSECLTPTPYLTGMCLMLERKIFMDAGMFGRDYRHGYFEDLALSCRIRNMGYQLAIREDCFVYHQGHVTYRDKSESEKREMIFHNLRVFESQWGHLPEHSELLRRMQYAGEVAPF